MGWVSRLSLRLRLLAFVVVATIPLIAVTAVNAGQDRAAAEESATAQLRGIAQLGATAYEQASAAAMTVLTELADEPFLIDSNPATCNLVLGQMGNAHPSFSALSVADLDGTVRCSGQANLIGASVSDRQYFQDVRARQESTLSGFLISRPANIPIVVYATPIFDSSGLAGVLILSVELTWFAEMLGAIELPPDTRVIVTASDHTVLTSAPVDSGIEVGTSLLTHPMAAEIGREPSGVGSFTDPLTGDDRLVGFQVVYTEAGRPLVAVTATTLKSTITAPAEASFRRNVGVVLAVAVVGTIVMWMRTTTTVQRPLAELVAATRRFASGEWSAKTSQWVWSPGMASEVRELATAFESMAEAVAEGQERLQHMATTDTLTGLPNRMEFVRVGDERMAMDPQAYTVATVAARDFSMVNSTFGYDGGDGILCQVGPRLRETFGLDTVVGRIGGDEFAALIPRATEQEVAARIAGLLGAPFDVHGEPIALSFVTGMAIAPADGTTTELLVRRAQVAARSALREGQEIARFLVSRDEPPQNQVQTLSALRQALQADALELWYQPKVNLRTGEVFGAEALSRWRGFGEEYISPEVFIPLAERSGLITSITRWALRRAARQSEDWSAAGWHLTLAVNVSARDLGDPTLPTWLEEIVGKQASGTMPIEVEVTETALMADPAIAARTCDELRALGIDIAIDDFGTGYSPLVYLHRLPVTALKIDQAFVRTINTSPESRSIIHAIVDLAHRLGLTVTAEGIEDAETAAYLREAGCDAGQGFYYSPPLPPDEFQAWLAGRVVAHTS